MASVEKTVVMFDSMTDKQIKRMKSNTNFADHVDWARNDRSLEVSGGDRTGHQEEGGLHLL